MDLAHVVGVVFLAVLFGWLALVVRGTKRAIDLDLEADERRP